MGQGKVGGKRSGKARQEAIRTGPKAKVMKAEPGQRRREKEVVIEIFRQQTR